MAFDDARGPGRGLPAIDDRLVVPETRYEMRDGELVFVSPADPPHGTRHAQLIALLEGHTGLAFEVACDLLTRTSDIADIAPDVSVYPEQANPETGGRQLEQLAFEVVSTTSLEPAGEKAADLVGRGVRRVFAVDVRRSRALEWSAALGGWQVLDATGHIVDPVLAVPLPIDALIHSARADDAVARALLSKRNPVIEEARARDRAEARARGKAEALLAVLGARGMLLDRAEHERILGECDPERVDRWIVRALTCATVTELLTEP